ncbi:hypothetical protein INT45_010527 [Circinella minor]|uniref:Myb-like, SWIRM and MPN domain-containing protein 1 n=1 Tax=Circinella minor TaxID=1195481 RepID=A0A8H7SAA1_9FUNG|nr:hypothetical protein INT45_010527 [Circinella minor]
MEDPNYCTADNMQDLLTSSVIMSSTSNTKFMTQHEQHHSNTTAIATQQLTSSPFHHHHHHHHIESTTTNQGTSITDPSSLIGSMYYTTQSPPPLQLSYEEPHHSHFQHTQEVEQELSQQPQITSISTEQQQEQKFDTTITTTMKKDTETTTIATSPTTLSNQQYEQEEESSPQPEKTLSTSRKHQETSSISLPSHNRRWTDEEDLLLQKGLLEFGYGKWIAISERVKTRNPLQCKNHARHWLLTEKMDENVPNQPTVNKSETDNKKIKKNKESWEEKTLTTPMIMMETSEPPSSPQPGPLFSEEQVTSIAVNQGISLNDNTFNISQDENTIITTTDNNENKNDNVMTNNNTFVSQEEKEDNEEECHHLDRNIITEDEKKNNPEWFCDSKSSAKSPERYMKIRNHILDSWHRVYKPEYMTKTAARKSLKDCGDVNAIGRVHAYLEKIKAINVGCVTNTKPRAPRRIQTTSSSSSSRRGYFYYEESDGEDDGNETPDDDYDGRSNAKGNGRNRPRPRRVTKKPQHYYDENGPRDTDDPFCLIPVEEYTDIDPPFHVDVASNALLMMDFHSHLSYTEIIGLLGGRYVHEERKLYVECVFPCRGTSSTDIECEMDPESEMKAREVFAHKGLSVVGWYHSHPTFEPNPSVRDIEYQQLYQTLFRDDTTGVEPFIGIIVNPSFAFEGDISRIQYVHIEQHRKNQEVIEQMTNLVKQFKGSDNDTDFDARMDKVIASLRANLPIMTEQMINLLNNLRALMHENDQPTTEEPSSSGPVSVM